MKAAVVGRGLIGTAAARYLALAGHDVVLVGPAEPQTPWADHKGVFASHYDEGRITRVGDRNPFYAQVSRASIDRYRQIEKQSGITFFTPCGALIAGGPEYMEKVSAARSSVTSVYDRLGPDGIRSRFSYLNLPNGTSGDHEPDDAGYISPRKLLQAQLTLATRAGVQLVEKQATGVDSDAVQVGTTSVECDQIIVAAGGWTDALLDRDPRHKVYARTVALHEIPADETRRLSTMPSIVLESPDVYILPPIRYPDGRTWLKLGGDPNDRVLRGQDEINAWFRSGGDPDVGDHLTRTLQKLVPGLKFTDRKIAPCVTTFTDSGLPELRRVSNGLTIAAAGNGAGAKCSDELGRMAAELACTTKEVIT